MFWKLDCRRISSLFALGVSAFPFHSILGQTVQILDRKSFPNSNASILVSVQGTAAVYSSSAPDWGRVWSRAGPALAAQSHLQCLASSPCSWLGIALLLLFVTKDTLLAQPVPLDTTLGCLSLSNTGSAAE